MRASIALRLQSLLDVPEDNILSNIRLAFRIGFSRDFIAQTCNPAISPDKQYY
jgi:hypothetical protein